MDIVIEHAVPQENGEIVWQPYLYKVDAERDFLLDDEHIDDAVSTIGQLQVRYGEMYARLKGQLERKKQKLDQVSNALYLEYRKALLKEGEKATEAALKAHVVTDASYQRAVDEYTTTITSYNLAETWWKTAQKKADLLQSVIYMKNSEIKRSGF